MLRAHLLGIALLLAPASLAGQTSGQLTLTVLDDVSGRPVADARVEVAGMRFPFRTDRSGVARIGDIPRGGRLVTVTRMGFAPGRLPVDLGDGEEAARTVRLSPEAVRLSGVTVRGDRRDARLEGNGFYRRERQGLGVHMTAERIDQLRPIQTIDLFRHVRGFNITYDKRGEPHVVSTRGISGLVGCAPLLYVDGMQVAARSAETGRWLEMVSPEMIAGIEAFAGPATIPAEYNPTGSACGVILVWTRTGSA